MEPSELNVPDNPSSEDICNILAALPAVDKGDPKRNLHQIQNNLNALRALRGIAVHQHDELNVEVTERRAVMMRWDAELNRLESHIARRKRDGTP